MDYTLPIALITAVSGILWVLDRWVWAPARHLSSGGTAQQPKWLEYSAGLFPILFVIFIFRSFVVEPFRIPSGSMEPTLIPGDFVLVNKFSYGIRLPLSHFKVIDASSPERGDVIVFRYPPNPKLDYIKRVVGLPGDEVVYLDKKLVVNGEPAPLTRPLAKRSRLRRAINTTGRFSGSRSSAGRSTRSSLTPISRPKCSRSLA